MTTIIPDVVHHTHPATSPARWLHPLAWWSWAVGVAIAASATTNPLLLAGLMVCVAFVVEQRKPLAPWARSFSFFVRLAVIVVAFRVLAQILFGATGGATEAFRLPGVELPSWLAGVRVGGAVMLEPLLAAFYDGLRLAAILIAIGAASSLASPARLLKSVPAAVYEIGVSVVVAATFLPQLVDDVQRVRANRRLRGRPERGIRGFAGAALPVLHGAMDRSITLAAAMDSRGYGRTAQRSALERRSSVSSVLAGAICVLVGLYGLMGTGSAPWWGPTFLLLGAIAMLVSIAMAGRRNIRTRYRPNAWHIADVGTALCGLSVAALFVLSSVSSPAAMHTSPMNWPSVPPWALVGLCAVIAPGFFTPRPPRTLTDVRAGERR